MLFIIQLLAILTLVHIQQQKQLLWLFSSNVPIAILHTQALNINRKTRTNNTTTKCFNNNCCVYLAFFIHFCCKITKPQPTTFIIWNKWTNDYKFGRLNAVRSTLYSFIAIWQWTRFTSSWIFLTLIFLWTFEFRQNGGKWRVPINFWSYWCY